MSLGDQLSHQAWLVDARSGESVTYEDLVARVNMFSATTLNLSRSASTQDTLVQVTAAIATGTDIVLGDANFNGDEFAALAFDSSGLKQTVSSGMSAALSVESLQKLSSCGSSARIGLFTSGSTGLPKLVWQSVANLARAVKVSNRQAVAVWALAYNPTHVAGIQVYLQALANGCTLVDVFGLDRLAVLAALERYEVTHISATPSFYRLLLPIDRPLSQLRSVTLGGESVDDGLLKKLVSLFPEARFHNVYASTEAGTLLIAEGDVFTISPELEDRILIVGGTIRVHGSLLGAFVSKGQTTEGGGQRPDEGWKQAENKKGATEDGRQTSKNEEPRTWNLETKAHLSEWYDTGDAVEIVSNSPLRFRIVARQRDWVNVGGSKVNPHEVEAVLGEHPDVIQVRVIGRKNSVLGQILCAEIVCRNPAMTEPHLRTFAASRLQAHKIPRLMRFVDNIAQTRTGKVSRQ